MLVATASGTPLIKTLLGPWLIDVSCSQRQTTSVQWTNFMPLVDLPIEIMHLEPPNSGHLSIPDTQYAPKVHLCTK